jgi:hypothetical protein
MSKLRITDIAGKLRRFHVEQQAAKVRYVVLDENTLGYINSEQPDVLGVLAASILRGAVHSWLDGPVAILQTKNIRPATVADFNAFRVAVPPDFKETR